jgi:predicted Rdx family selenoprotein
MGVFTLAMAAPPRAPRPFVHVHCSHRHFVVCWLARATWLAATSLATWARFMCAVSMDPDDHLPNFDFTKTCVVLALLSASHKR